MKLYYVFIIYILLASPIFISAEDNLDRGGKSIDNIWDELKRQDPQNPFWQVEYDMDKMVKQARALNFNIPE